MSTSISITTQDVPQSFCFQSWPQAWPFLVGLLQGSFAGDLNTINFGNTTPSSEDRDKPWLRTNADGTPDGWYAYANGAWLRRYSGPDPGFIGMWGGAEAGIDTLDGGEVGAATETTGPFWERVTAFDGRFPLGVGTISGAAVAVGAAGGADAIELEMENIPLHDHGLPGIKVLHSTAPIGVIHADSGNDISVSTLKAEGGNTSGATVSHANVPPYRATFFIRRTARLYHRAP